MRQQPFLRTDMSSSFRGDSGTTGDENTDDVKIARPHRCNARLEDFIQVRGASC